MKVKTFFKCIVQHVESDDGRWTWWPVMWTEGGCTRLNGEEVSRFEGGRWGYKPKNIYPHDKGFLDHVGFLSPKLSDEAQEFMTKAFWQLRLKRRPIFLIEGDEEDA
jgi:hypothetical protein